MVDFNAGETIARSPHQLNVITILQRRYDAIEAIEAYRKLQHRGAVGEEYAVKSRIETLFIEIRATMKANSEKNTEAIEKKVYDTDVQKNMQAFLEIDEYLLRKGVIKFDVRQVRDITNVEEENRAYGY